MSDVRVDMNVGGDVGRRSDELVALIVLTNCVMAVAVSRFTLEQEAGWILFWEMLNARRVNEAIVWLGDRILLLLVLSSLMAMLARAEVIALISSCTVPSSAVAVAVAASEEACISSCPSWRETHFNSSKVTRRALPINTVLIVVVAVVIAVGFWFCLFK